MLVGTGGAERSRFVLNKNDVHRDMNCRMGFSVKPWIRPTKSRQIVQVSGSVLRWPRARARS
jgi:hypothetical protein